jgi:hypothetical protein
MLLIHFSPSNSILLIGDFSAEIKSNEEQLCRQFIGKFRQGKKKKTRREDFNLLKPLFRCNLQLTVRGESGTNSWSTLYMYQFSTQQGTEL